MEMNKTPLESLTAALAYAMGVEPPRYAQPANEDLTAYVDRCLAGQKADRVFIYNTDARSLGVVDMIESIIYKRPARASGKLACHALEIMLAFEKSAAAGSRVVLETTCDRPEAMLPVVEDGQIS